MHHARRLRCLQPELLVQAAIHGKAQAELFPAHRTDCLRRLLVARPDCRPSGGTGTASVGTDHAPSLTEFVNDEMRLLAPSEKYALEEKLNQFNHETSIQMAIAILAEPTDADLQEFTIQVADKARLGQSGPDNGLNLFVFRSKESRGLKSATAWKARYPIWWRIGC